MNKLEFFEVVKAASIEPSAVQDLVVDENGVIESAVIEVQNDAHLPVEITRRGCGSGLFYSRVRYRAGDDECWAADAGYEWNDSQTTFGDESACDPATCFAALEDAAAEATYLAEGMAEDLQREVEQAIEDGVLEGFTPGWSGCARFDLAAQSEAADQ